MKSIWMRKRGLFLLREDESGERNIACPCQMPLLNFLQPYRGTPDNNLEPFPMRLAADINRQISVEILTAVLKRMGRSDLTQRAISLIHIFVNGQRGNHILPSVK